MKSRWSDTDAEQALSRWGERFGNDFALRLYTARLIGQDPDLLLHGGGNVSIKRRHKTLLGDEIDVVYVKASGADMAALGPEGMPAVDLKHLVRLRGLPHLDDDAMVNEIRTHLLRADDPTPSIETLLHAFLPHKFIDHSHADAVLCLTNQARGDALIREALGDRVAYVPYVKPGFDLAKAVAAVVEGSHGIEGVVLLQHGLITFADDVRTSYERHIEIVDACERFIRTRVGKKSLTVSCGPSGEQPDVLAARVAPILRGLLATPTGDADQPHRRVILEWRAGEELLRTIGSNQMKRLAAAGALTGDHLIRTGARPLLVETPQWGDAGSLRTQLENAVADYRREYSRYLASAGVNETAADTSPKVILLPGAGVFCFGPAKRDAVIAADIAEHTLKVKAAAELIGSYQSLSDDELLEMEFRGLQRRKLGIDSSQVEDPLAGQVVVISGGAGAIGSAIAEVCVEAGAHVVVTDLEADALAAVVRRIEQRFGKGRAAAVRMDVTDESSVQAGFDQIARLYGGVDVLVPNAGIAHVASLDEIRPDDFRRVMDVNATGYLLFMQAGARVMKEQKTGGNIVLISSKNVLSPGKQFGAYSASKAAAHQLGRMAAIELAEHGIRVNMITPDAVFTSGHTEGPSSPFDNTDSPSGGPQPVRCPDPPPIDDIPSKLWEQVGPQRAAARGLRPEDLPEYYRRRNLLKARVTGLHVGRAVVFFASNATPTTGAVLPIDGGLPDAFPR